MGIYNFHKKYYFLSLDYPCEVKLDGIVYPNLKRAYAAVRFSSKKYKEYCLNCSDKELKYIINYMTNGPLIDSNFSKNKLDPLLKLLQLKFQDGELKQQLLDTGDEALIYLEKLEPVLGRYRGEGENLLGVALSDIRMDLRSQS